MNKAQRAIKTLYKRGYRVTKSGRCINPEGIEMSHKLKSNHKYLQSQISIDGECVNFHHHRLAAYCKYGDKMFEKGIVVRHLDGNHINNNWNNIAIGTYSENERDKCPKIRSMAGRVANGHRKETRRLTMRKLTESDVRDIRERLEKGEVGTELAKEYSVHKETIYQIKRRETYKDVI